MDVRKGLDSVEQCIATCSTRSEKCAPFMYNVSTHKYFL